MAKPPPQKKPITRTSDLVPITSLTPSQVR